MEKLEKARKDYEKKVWLPALREALDHHERAQRKKDQEALEKASQ
jgi:hypothetical protein